MVFFLHVFQIYAKLMMFWSLAGTLWISFFFYYNDRVEYRARFPSLVFDLILKLEQMCCDAATGSHD